MTLFITLTLAQADTGPFNLYSNVDGYLSAIAVNVSKATLLTGLSLPSAPNGTTIVRVKSTGVCNTVLDLPLGVTTTTSTSSTSTTSSTTTTTSSSTTTSTTTVDPAFVSVYRVNIACCTPPNPAERLVSAAGFILSGPQTTFTGVDGKPYTIMSETPIMGIPNITKSVIDTQVYGNCGEWLAFNISCP